MGRLGPDFQLTDCSSLCCPKLSQSSPTIEFMPSAIACHAKGILCSQISTIRSKNLLNDENKEHLHVSKQTYLQWVCSFSYYRAEMGGGGECAPTEISL